MTQYLFVSSKCKHCDEIIALSRENTDICESIQLVSIEENMNNLPTFLKKVPTLETEDKVYHGQEVFTWLQQSIDAKKSLDIMPADDFSRSFCSFKDDENPTYCSDKYAGLNEKQGSEGVSEADFNSNDSNGQSINIDLLTQQRKEQLQMLTKRDEMMK